MQAAARAKKICARNSQENYMVFFFYLMENYMIIMKTIWFDGELMLDILKEIYYLKFKLYEENYSDEILK